MLSSGALRSLERVSRATLTIVVSSTDMIAPRITTIAMGQRVLFIYLASFRCEKFSIECFGVKTFTRDPSDRL